MAETLSQRDLSQISVAVLPSGSAMPLVWAHAEYLKLRRSLQESRVFDLPPQTVQRYLIEKTGSPRIAWRFNHKIRSMPAGKILRIETMAPVIRWSVDDWHTVQDDKRAMPGSECISSIWRPKGYPKERRSDSLSTGQTLLIGKVWTSSSTSVLFDAIELGPTRRFETNEG
jgi:hypothetical protein